VEIALAALANDANVASDGNLNLLGIFDTIGASGFPVRHPTMAFAFRVRFEYDDQNKAKRLDIRLLNQDGKVLFNAKAQIQVGTIPPGQFVHANQILFLRGTEFAGEGRYRFRIEGAGKEPHDTVFQVVKVRR